MAARVAYLLLSSFIGLINGQSYPITGTNSIANPACAGSTLSISRTLGSVVKGDIDNPCTGYMELSSESVCMQTGIPAGLPVKAMAQRACYTLGHSMWRGSNFQAGSTDQIMLYDCDMYTEAGVSTVTAGEMGAGWEGHNDGVGNDIVGTHCLNGAHDDCFEPCYDNDVTVGNGFISNVLCEADTQFWAVTCVDIDECHVGVHAECTGPFLESCTPRPACGEHAKCSNTQGGWTCMCENGFTSVNPYVNDCYDIDECQDENICGYHAQCINKPGSYICVCLRPELYDADTKSCEKSTCPALTQIPYATAEDALSSSPEYGDEVTFRCIPGFKVMDYSPVYFGHDYFNYYYYSGKPENYYYTQYHTAAISFTLKCDSSGYWTPYPVPVCKPLQCRDPGHILHALRTGDGWRYDDEVTYTCEAGYQPRSDSGSSSFSIRCQSDGTWTQGTTCVDVNECEKDPGICSGYAKYCINTVGSYICSCTPWYSEESNDYCHYYEYGKPELPSPCDQMDYLGICKHGYCVENDGKASCECDLGYEGTTCDRRGNSTALILAIIALVLGGVILILFFLCCLRRDQNLLSPPPMAPPIDPIYGPKPMSRWNAGPRRPFF